MMPKGYLAVLIVGVLLLLAGLVFIALDYTGMGDTSGLDPKDLAFLAVGIVLAAAGAVGGSRRKTPPPETSKGTPP